MTLPDFASIDDLEDRLPAPLEAQLERAVLESVSSAIRGVTAESWVDDDDALIAMPAAAAAVLKSVCVEVALRVLRNPDGALQATDTVGPSTESRTWQEAGLTFNDVEREQLAWATSIAYADDDSAIMPGLGVLTTTRGPLETRTIDDDGVYVGDRWWETL